MPYEIDFPEISETKEQRIKKFLLARINKNKKGVWVDELWEELKRDSGFRDDNLVDQDIGPVLLSLLRDNLIEGVPWYCKEGERVTFQPVLAFGWIDRVICVFLGHALPDKSAFESIGALFEGGICTRCGGLSQGKFLGNVWTSEKEEDGVIILEGYDLSKAFERGLRVRQIP